MSVLNSMSILKNKYKGLILAAGYGTRLKPITDQTPKPLIPFFNKPILFYAIDKFKEYGVNNIAINTCHLAEKIELAVQNYDVDKIVNKISREHQILGTGGALIPLMDWLEGSDLIIYNGDIISSIDFNKVVKQHEKSGSTATMVLLSNHLEGTNSVFVEEKLNSITNEKQHLIRGIGKEVKVFRDEKKENLKLMFSKHTFGCCHVLSNEFIKKSLKKVPLSGLKNGNSVNIIDFYLWSIEKNEVISAYLHNDFWEDIGTPENLFRSHKKMLDLMKTKHQKFTDKREENFNFSKNEFVIESTPEDKKGNKIHPPSFISSKECLSGRSEIGPNVVVCNDVKIPKDVIIKESILLPGAVIKNGEFIERKIVGPNYQVSI